MNRVYCKNCKYLKWIENYGFDPICMKHSYYRDTWQESNGDFIQCHADVHNSKNDCIDFEQKKPWWKFWRNK